MSKLREHSLHGKNDSLESLLNSRDRVVKNLCLKDIPSIFYNGDKVLFIEDPSVDSIREGVLVADSATHATIRKLDGAIVKVSPFAVLPFPKITFDRVNFP